MVHGEASSKGRLAIYGKEVSCKHEFCREIGKEGDGRSGRVKCEACGAEFTTYRI